MRILAQAADDTAFTFISRGDQEGDFIISWTAMGAAEVGVKRAFFDKFERTCDSGAFQQLIGRAGIKKAGLPPINGKGGVVSHVYAVPGELRNAIPARPDEPMAPGGAVMGNGSGAGAVANLNGDNSNGGNANDCYANPPPDYQSWCHHYYHELVKLRANHEQLREDHTQLLKENHRLRMMLKGARDTFNGWVSDLTGMMCGMGIDDSVNCEVGSSGSTESSSRGDDGSDSVMDE